MLIASQTFSIETNLNDLTKTIFLQIIKHYWEKLFLPEYPWLIYLDSYDWFWSGMIAKLLVRHPRMFALMEYYESS